MLLAVDFALILSWFDAGAPAYMLAVVFSLGVISFINYWLYFRPRDSDQK